MSHEASFPLSIYKRLTTAATSKNTSKYVTNPNYNCAHSWVLLNHMSMALTKHADCGMESWKKVRKGSIIWEKLINCNHIYMTIHSVTYCFSGGSWIKSQRAAAKNLHQMHWYCHLMNCAFLCFLQFYVVSEQTNLNQAHARRPRQRRPSVSGFLLLEEELKERWDKFCRIPMMSRLRGFSDR